MEFKKKEVDKQLLHDVLNNLPGFVFRTINDGLWSFIYASSGSKDLLGYAPDELINFKNFSRIIPKEDQKANQIVLSRLSPTHPNYKVVYKVQTFSGEIKWVQEEGTGTFSSDDKLLYLDGHLLDITDQKLAEEKLLKENSRLRENITKHHRLNQLIGKSLAMTELFELITKAANSRATVVVTGESGTGKELAARAIHNLSDRSDKPFVVVNCELLLKI
jgi:PAS domain S-box-containing protein